VDYGPGKYFVGFLVIVRRSYGRFAEILRWTALRKLRGQLGFCRRLAFES
jgi:hypothetical protein